MNEHRIPPKRAHTAIGSSPVDPLDGYDDSITPYSNGTPHTAYEHSNTFEYSKPNDSDSHFPDERRLSMLSFTGGFSSVLTGASLRHARENDKLVNYVEKSSRLQFARELRTYKLIGNITRLFQWDLCYKDEKELKSIKNKRLVQFYEDQNELIERYSEIDKLLDSGIHHKMIKNYAERNNHQINTFDLTDDNYGSTDNEDGLSPINSRKSVSPVRPQVHRRNSAVPGNIDSETDNLLGYNKQEEIRLVDSYISLNFATNVVLLVGKIIVAILTASISIVASLIDSALDFLSTVIIYFANKLAQSKHSKNFPIGKNRLEPIGVLVFSVIIIISFTQVGIEAVNKLIYDGDKEIVEIGLNATLIMLLTIVTKFACYIYGRTIKSSSAQALAQDALVDVIFNIFSLLMPVLGYYFQIYWFDPLGALLLSFYIIYLWSQTCFEHIIHLTGHKADPLDYRTVLYLCMRFSKKISKIKELNCYHVGDSINVEVDVILDNVKDMRDSHDLAEALQYTLEALPMINIERAFVHTDYEVDNFKGHLRG